MISIYRYIDDRIFLRGSSGIEWFLVGLSNSDWYIVNIDLSIFYARPSLQKAFLKKDLNDARRLMTPYTYYQNRQLLYNLKVPLIEWLVGYRRIGRSSILVEWLSECLIYFQIRNAIMVHNVFIALRRISLETASSYRELERKFIYLLY